MGCNDAVGNVECVEQHMVFRWTCKTEWWRRL